MKKKVCYNYLWVQASSRLRGCYLVEIGFYNSTLAFHTSILEPRPRDEACVDVNSYELSVTSPHQSITKHQLRAWETTDLTLEEATSCNFHLYHEEKICGATTAWMQRDGGDKRTNELYKLR